MGVGYLKKIIVVQYFDGTVTTQLNVYSISTIFDGAVTTRFNVYSISTILLHYFGKRPVMSVRKLSTLILRARMNMKLTKEVPLP